ncbi:hypothetical protein GINT2_000470 [Glugoides intestinalis]
METMASSSNNTQKEISVWEVLVWSIQTEGLLSTKSLIVISIVIFLIMRLWNGRMYYNNNLLNGFLIILLTIISVFIFGKGFEIIFITLHIFSGAYGNVVFSLADIFISLLFGSSLMCFGYEVFIKVLHELLRLLSVDADKEEKAGKEATENELKTSEDAELKTAEAAERREIRQKAAEEAKRTEIRQKAAEAAERREIRQKAAEEAKRTEIRQKAAEEAELKAVKEAKLEATMTNNKARFVDRLKAMRDYLKLKMEGKPEETGPKLKKILFKFYKTESKLKKIGIKIKEKVDYLNQMKAEPEANVKAEINESNKKLMSNISKKLLSSNLNEAGLKAIKAGLDGIVAGFEEYNAILTKCKAAEEAKRTKIRQNAAEEAERTEIRKKAVDAAEERAAKTARRL